VIKQPAHPRGSPLNSHPSSPHTLAATPSLIHGDGGTEQCVCPPPLVQKITNLLEQSPYKSPRGVTEGGGWAMKDTLAQGCVHATTPAIVIAGF